ncbi:C40 family peptidase, partial [Mycolicibacterium tusciae]|uniref:C40 family peptidase n=1 Tax=Mycolicibacterium tusciae TaxID=75922 RepID=UPI001F34E29A
MFAVATLLTLVNSVSGTPYVTGGDSPAGTDCSGLVSWVTNAATGRPVYGDRFHTGNIEQALLARGFQYGTQPGALNVGWNGGHTAATLPDGTPVSSGEGGGVKIGGGGAYQSQFNNHMFLPMPPDQVPPPPGAPIVLMNQQAPMPPAPPMAPPPPPVFSPPPCAGGAGGAGPHRGGGGGGLPPRPRGGRRRRPRPAPRGTPRPAHPPMASRCS